MPDFDLVNDGIRPRRESAAPARLRPRVGVRRRQGAARSRRRAIKAPITQEPPAAPRAPRRPRGLRRDRFNRSPSPTPMLTLERGRSLSYDFIVWRRESDTREVDFHCKYNINARAQRARRTCAYAECASAGRRGLPPDKQPQPRLEDEVAGAHLHVNRFHYKPERRRGAGVSDVSAPSRDADMNRRVKQHSTRRPAPRTLHWARGAAEDAVMAFIGWRRSQNICNNNNTVEGYAEGSRTKDKRVLRPRPHDAEFLVWHVLHFGRLRAGFEERRRRLKKENQWIAAFELS
ncbi:hypothetical protein EVAR_25265_1 [Eumeta japonica]|uniref:Uncharacterized protein n=1 Tax=Eumeta variegata TaxID=151549 RepID=A0A4C1VP11_EUMVA|nr:hypothetical protein EVAR_25265_1 [Eumeta japonica]